MIQLAPKPPREDSPRDDIWVLWPDGFMCPVDELDEFGHRSDDFHRVRVDLYDETGMPSVWEIVK